MGTYPALRQLAARRDTIESYEARRALGVLDLVARGWNLEDAERLWLSAELMEVANATY